MSESVEDAHSAVLMVHGTNDGAETTTGGKWWQTGSTFGASLQQALSERGEQVELVPFQWSGANSDLARQKGAKALARAIMAHGRKFKSVHVVAHSHGGNVANTALDRVGWDRARRASALTSAVMVGTPFLKRRITAMQVFSAFAFLVIALVGAPMWVRFVTENLPMGMLEDASGAGAFLIGWWVGAAAAGASILIPICITVYVAVGGVRRVLRRRINPRSTRAMLAIRHPQDEAISFLQKVDEVELEPIPKGALMRGSRNLAIAASVQVVIWMAVALLFAIAYREWVGHAPVWIGGAFVDRIAAGAERYILYLSAVFCGLYLTGRLLFGVFPETFLRKWFNERLARSVRGIALGSDGVARLGDVSTTSHTQKTREVVLAGDVVEHMKHAAAQRASELIDKYRWSLFTAGADANRSLSDLAEDALTWKSLIHTTYFDQPAVVAVIADHIAAEAANARRKHV